MAEVSSVGLYDAVINALNGAMKGLTPEQRLIVVDSIMLGYCKECGEATLGRICTCVNPKSSVD